MLLSHLVAPSLRLSTHEEPRKATRAQKARIIAAARVNAITHVIFREGRPIEQEIKKVSLAADLAILGRGLSEPRLHADAFFERIDAMLHPMPITLLVHSARTFDGELLLVESEGDSP